MSPHISLASSSRRPRRWTVPTVLLLLTAATVNLVSRAGQPFIVSSLDIVFLLALAVVSGIYVILALANGQSGRRLEEEPPVRDTGAAEPGGARSGEVPVRAVAGVLRKPRANCPFEAHPTRALTEPAPAKEDDQP